MATTKDAFLETARNPGSLKHRQLHIPTGEGVGGRLPQNIFAQLFEKNMAPIIGGGMTPDLSTTLTVPGFTASTGGTGDPTGYSTSGGLLITAPSDDDFNINLESALQFTPATGIWYGMMARIEVSHATQIGFRMGFGNSQALPFTTDYTDQVTISKAIASALVVGKVRGNSGTVADTGTLGTIVAATEIEVGFYCYLHATAQAGYFFYNETATVFTADQLTALATILTTPPTCMGNINATGTTGNTPTMTVTSFIAGQDN